MAKVWRYLKLTLLWTFGILGGLVLLLILINLKDANLDPAAVTAMEFPGVQTDKANAYYALYGFKAPAGADPHATGLQFVTAVNAAYASKEGAATDKPPAPDAVKFSGESPDKWCPRDKIDCLDAYRANRAPIRRLAQDNALLLQRYRALYRYTVFQETVTRKYMGNLPHLLTAENALTRALIGLDAVDGNADAAFAALAKDIRFWRQVLQGASSVITKTVASALLDRDFALLAEILKRYQDRPQMLAAAKAALKPLSDQERSFAEAFRGEYALGAHLVLELPDKLRDPDMAFSGHEVGIWEPIMASLFFKRHASVNMLFQSYRDRLRLTQAPADKLIPVAEALAAEDRERHDIARVSLVYNPIGKILFAISDASSQGFARYIGRVHNLDGRMRLIALQLALYQAHVPEAQVPKFIAASPPAQHDPYRAAPMAWDAKRRVLFFLGMGRAGPELKLDHEVAVRL